MLKEDHWKQPDDESSMIKGQLRNIIDNAQSLIDNIGDSTQFDAWVQSHIAKAEDYVQSACNYMKYHDEDDHEIAGSDEISVPTEEPEVGMIDIDVEDQRDFDIMRGDTLIDPFDATEESPEEGEEDEDTKDPFDIEDEEEFDEEATDEEEEDEID